MQKQLRQLRSETVRRIRDRDRRIAELSRKLAEQNRTLGELNRRVVEFNQRFDDIASEVTHVRVADDLRVKQKCISATDAASTSSSGEMSLPEQSAVLPKPETSNLTVSGSAKTDSKKRKLQLPVDKAAKCSKKADSATAVSDARCLRSGHAYRK